MKTLKIFLGGLIMLLGVTIADSAKAQPGFRANVSFNDFYVTLSPYGRWMNMPRYGQVWIYNQSDFRPYYTNGQWMETDLGYSWSSGYPWGWATFHYGRWEYDPFYGWFWIPGYEYAPAWVVWSEANGYYGWAPLGFGVDINISIGLIPANRWMYVPRARIGYARIDRYGVPQQRAHIYYKQQRPIVNVHVYNNVRYDRGPVRQNNNRQGYAQNNYRNNGNNINNNPNYGSRPERRRSEVSAPPTAPNNNVRPQPSNPPTSNQSGSRPEIIRRPEARNYNNSNNNNRSSTEILRAQERAQSARSSTQSSQSPRINRNESNVNRSQGNSNMSQERKQRVYKAESMRR